MCIFQLPNWVREQRGPNNNNYKETIVFNKYNRLPDAAGESRKSGSSDQRRHTQRRGGEKENININIVRKILAENWQRPCRKLFFVARRFDFLYNVCFASFYHSFSEFFMRGPNLRLGCAQSGYERNCFGGSTVNQGAAVCAPHGAQGSTHLWDILRPRLCKRK